MQSEERKTMVSEVVENTADITADAIEEVRHDERRKYQRRAARWSATITTKDKTVVQCRTRDVSERGASVSTPYDFNMNAIIILEIHIVYKDVRKTIRALGQVKHSSVAADGFTIGVFIKDAAEPVMNFLRAYSNKLL